MAKCPKCGKEMKEQPWIPPRGYDSRMFKLKCSSCGVEIFSVDRRLRTRNDN